MCVSWEGGFNVRLAWCDRGRYGGRARYFLILSFKWGRAFEGGLFLGIDLTWQHFLRLNHFFLKRQITITAGSVRGSFAKKVVVCSSHHGMVVVCSFLSVLTFFSVPGTRRK